jgi:hypothetical protein
MRWSFAFCGEHSMTVTLAEALERLNVRERGEGHHA